MITVNNRKTVQTNRQQTEKDLEVFLRLQQQELKCQKQIKVLYTKLSKTFERGVSLQSQKNQLQNNKIHLNTDSNPTQQSLSKQLMKLRQQFKSAEIEYASINKDLISNSSKIKEAIKEINTNKQIITQKQQLFQQMKRQSQHLKQKQANAIDILKELQLNIKAETLKKIALMKAPKQDNQSSERQQILRKISEMKKINEALTQMLTS